MRDEDEDLIEPIGVPEIYVDNFTKHRRRNGNMTCGGYRDLPEGRVLVVRLVWPAQNTSAAIEDAQRALQSPEFAPARKNGGNGRKRVH